MPERPNEGVGSIPADVMETPAGIRAALYFLDRDLRTHRDESAADRAEIRAQQVLLRERLATMTQNGGPNPSDTGWHDNVERGWSATIGANPFRVLVAGAVGALLILAFSVALAVCRSDDPLHTLTRSVERQSKAIQSIGADVDDVEAGVDSLVSGAAPND